MDRPDEPKQRVPGPRSHAERRFSGTAARPRAHAAAARLAPVARHAGGTRPARPRTRGGDRQPAAVTYEAIADRKIGHAALRPEICSGIVGGQTACQGGKEPCISAMPIRRSTHPRVCAKNGLLTKKGDPEGPPQTPRKTFTPRYERGG